MFNVLILALVSPIDIEETLSCFASLEVAVLFILNLAFLRGISWLRLVFMKMYLEEKHSFGFDFGFSQYFYLTSLENVSILPIKWS